MSYSLRKQLDSAALTSAYMMTIIAAGSVVVLLAAISFPYRSVDLNFALLALCTVVIGPYLTIRIPKLKTHVAVSDTFIFLTLLLYGPEAAVLIAAVEAFMSARRFCSRYRTMLFNAAALAISISAVGIVLQLGGLLDPDKLHGTQPHLKEFLIVLCLMALVQFAVNTVVACSHDAIKTGGSFFQIWKNDYIWTFLSYFIGAAGAGALIQLFDQLGFGVILAAFPIALFLFLTYRMYLKNVAMSVEQAEQAELHARDLQEHANALRDSEARFRSAFNYAPIGIAMISGSGKWLKVNRAFCNILGYRPEELLELNFQSVIAPDDLGAALVKLNQVLSGKVASAQAEQRFVHRSGISVWASWSLSAASDNVQESDTLILQVQDITDRKVAEEKLQHEATHDALTGLPNRAYFMTRLRGALKKRSSVPGYMVSVLFIDLDRFKLVNDSLGHLVGDQLLVAISRRLRDCMRPPDTVARLGGDEFIILVEGVHELEKVSEIAERIQSTFEQAFNIRGHEIFSSASIGILHASEQHSTAEEMIRDADTAMYQAKRAGKARHEVFRETMRTEVKKTLQLETDLRRAIRNRDIELRYQPIFDLMNDQVVAIEALARWEHPDFGSVAPGEFVKLAEEIGWIDALGEQIMTRACAEIGGIYGSLGEADLPRLSLNLSARQFAKADLSDRLCAILDATGFPATSLKLEITESVFFEYEERAIAMLEDLRALGIESDIDDFGTGYSNLSFLVRLPVSTLKIDRSFVHSMGEDGANTEIVRTILSMAKSLDLAVVAEGIETKNQLVALKRLGCEFGQGYLLARPMDAIEIKTFLLGRDGIGQAPPPPGDVSVVQTIQ